MLKKFEFGFRAVVFLFSLGGTKPVLASDEASPDFCRRSFLMTSLTTALSPSCPRWESRSLASKIFFHKFTVGTLVSLEMKP